MMGLLTRGEIKDQLKVALGGRDDRSDTELNLYIALGYTLISQPEVHRHEQLKVEYDIPLVASTTKYDISRATVGYNILAIRFIEFLDSTDPVPFDARSTKVDPRPEEWFTNRTARSVTGGPRHYHRAGDALWIDLAPSAADVGKILRMHVFREPAPLAGNDSKTVLDDYFDNALILAAEYHARLRLGYRELAINTRQEMQNYVNQRADAGEMNTDPGDRAEVRHESSMPRT